MPRINLYYNTGQSINLVFFYIVYDEQTKQIYNFSNFDLMFPANNKV